MWFEILKRGRRIRVMLNQETLEDEFDKWYMQNDKTRITVDEVMNFIDIDEIAWDSIAKKLKYNPGSLSNLDHTHYMLVKPDSRFVKNIRRSIRNLLGKNEFVRQMGRNKNTMVWVRQVKRDNNVV